MKRNRRDFIKMSSGLIAGLPLIAQCSYFNKTSTTKEKPVLYAKKYSVNLGNLVATFSERPNEA